MRKVNQMKIVKKSMKNLLSATALIALAASLCGCEGLGSAMVGGLQDTSNEINGRYGTLNIQSRADQIEQQVYDQNHPASGARTRPSASDYRCGCFLDCAPGLFAFI